MEPILEPLQEGEIVKLIHAATESVFSTMLNLPAEPQAVHQDRGDPAPVDGVIALVGIAGNWTGTGHIYCTADFACQLAGALLMTEYKCVDADVLDAVAEVANMIIGNVKTSLENLLGPLGLSVPTVIYGRNYQARTGGVQNWIVIPYRCGTEIMEIRFCLVQTAASVKRLVRPETALV